MILARLSSDVSIVSRLVAILTSVKMNDYDQVNFKTRHRYKLNQKPITSDPDFKIESTSKKLGTRIFLD